MPSKRPRRLAEVVDLSQVRAQKRLGLWRQKVDRVVDSNRRALDRLHAGGGLFTLEGTRIGRDLLLAHQHLLEVRALLDQLCDGVSPAPRKRRVKVEAVLLELDSLLGRASALTERSGSYLSRPRSERP